MPFQPDSAIDTALWRWQFTNAQSQVISEVYINLGFIKFIKTTRTNPPVVGGQTPTVSIWYYGSATDKNPDVTLDGNAAIAFLADLDAIWAE
jgi:hypothetical protein